MASLGDLKLPSHKKKYIVEKLTPLLEEMVTDTLMKLPDDPATFMGDWLRAKKMGGVEPAGHSSGTDPKLSSENERLKEEIRHLTTRLQASNAAIASAAPAGAADPDDEEEPEADEDEEVEEVPQKPVTKVGARQAVSAEAYGKWNQKKDFTPPNYPKNAEQTARIRSVLQKSFLFQSLEEKDLLLVVGAMSEVVLEPKTRVIKQGDNGDFLFVIEMGMLDCYKKFPNAPEEKLVKTCEPGDCFGELALLYNVPRAASVESRDKCILWRLDRETFNTIVRDSAAKKREAYDRFLQSVPLLAGMDTYERSQVADAIKVENFKKGDVVIKEGDKGDKFFLIEEGECSCLKKKNGVDTKVMALKSGDYFGELALLNDAPRAATVVAESPSKLLVLDRRSFKRLLGPIQDILSRGTSRYSK